MKPFAAAVAIAVLCATPQTRRRADRHRALLSSDQTARVACSAPWAKCEAAKGRTTYFEQCLTRTDTQGTTGLGQSPQPIGPPSYPDLPPVKPQDLGR